MAKETKTESFSAKRIIWSGIIFIIIGFLFIPQANNKQTIKQSPRQLVGIFKLPANGTIVDKDENGQELWYRKGEYVRFQQLGSPGKFTVVNKRPAHQCWTSSRRVAPSGRAEYSDKIRLMAARGKEIIVQARIIPSRS